MIFKGKIHVQYLMSQLYDQISIKNCVTFIFIYFTVCLILLLLLLFKFQSCKLWYVLLTKRDINPKHLISVEGSIVFEKNMQFLSRKCMFSLPYLSLDCSCYFAALHKTSKEFNKMLHFRIFISKLSAFQEMWKAALLKYYFFIVLSGKLEALVGGLSHLFRKAYNSTNYRYEALCDSWSQTENWCTWIQTVILCTYMEMFLIKMFVDIISI